MATLNKDYRAAYNHQNRVNSYSGGTMRKKTNKTDFIREWLTQSSDQIVINNINIPYSRILKYLNSKSYKSENIIRFENSYGRWSNNEDFLIYDHMPENDKPTIKMDFYHLSQSLIQIHKRDNFEKLIPLLINELKIILYKIDISFISKPVQITLEIYFKNKIISTHAFKT